ncbi:MAG: dethiobiotin synthase, partial [Planctomycetota bacterium]
SRARVQVYRHLDLEDLDRRLQRCTTPGRRIVLSESIFSMDGDAAAVDELLELCARHDASLILDEAHAVGLLGEQGRGLGPGSHPQLLARMVGAGKALGGRRIIKKCDRVLRDHLVNHARAFVFSTAPVPAMAGSLVAAIELCQGMDSERGRVTGLATRLAANLGLPRPAAAILPFILGSDAEAVALAEGLNEQGFHVRAVRPPTVPEGSARLRLVLHLQNSEAEVDALSGALSQEAPLKQDPETSRLTRTLFVVGTDTGVGKTVVSAALLRAWRRRTEARYWKPVQTGDESDTQQVASLAEVEADRFPQPARSFPLPASPHQAAADVGEEIDPREIRRRFAELRGESEPMLVELAGGIHVPYLLEGDGPRLQIDWLALERQPLVLVARSGLGTLNHSLLTLEALRARSLEPLALILVGPRHAENAAALRQLARIEVIEMPEFEAVDAASLDAWIDAVDLGRLLPEEA